MIKLANILILLLFTALSSAAFAGYYHHRDYRAGWHHSGYNHYWHYNHHHNYHRGYYHRHHR